MKILCVGRELPAVVMNVCGTREVVVHEETGLLVRRGSTEELARGIRYLLVDSVMRENIMGAASRRRIGQHIDIDQAMKRPQSVILAGGTPRRNLSSRPCEFGII